MRACGKAWAGERRSRKNSITGGEADTRIGARIEIGMRSQEPFLFGLRRMAEAVHIMVAVAFRVSDADQRAEREIC